MDNLDQILTSYMADGGTPGKDQLLGAAFVVVNKDGESIDTTKKKTPLIPVPYVSLDRHKVKG